MPPETVANTIKDPVRWAALAVLAVAALIVWSQAQSRLVQPIDRLVVNRLCIDYGDEVGREALESEPPGGFFVFGRSDGFCRLGVGPNDEAPVTVSIAETDPGPRYRAARWIGLIIQLGVVSLFLRLTVEPVLDFAAMVRRRFLAEPPREN